ncbi:hypothetical protein B9S64_31735 [Streptomyces sp. SM18]|nr:hypothetical protein B9S64_31735 [Streptomyces sp. SM18]
MNGAESDVLVVARILPFFHRIVPTAVDEGPAGTATRNYVARDSDWRPVVREGLPGSTDLDAGRRALEHAPGAAGAGPARLRGRRGCAA